MDRYKKLKAVQGLVMSMDEQIYRYDQKKDVPQQEYRKLIDQYYDSILKFLTKEEVKDEKAS